MNLSIQISDSMSTPDIPMGVVEDRLIRLPESIRIMFNFPIGSYVILRKKDGGKLPLQVAKCYTNDIYKNALCGYVSRNTFEKLSVQKILDLDPAQEILVGCDPEFFIVDSKTEERVTASYFFPKYGGVGSDAGLAELRPHPAFDENTLVNNLRELLTIAHRALQLKNPFYMRPVKMLAASNHYNASAGFHIHFGLPDLFLHQPQLGNPLMLLRMVEILDYYVGISSIIPEGNADFIRRSNMFSQYGKPSDYRYTHITLEYRVPGGHLLRHPLLTAGLFAISSTVIQDMMTRIREYTNNYTNLKLFDNYNDMRALYPKLPSKEEVYLAITSADIRRPLQYLETLQKDLSNMIGYQKREQTIGEYFKYIYNAIEKGDIFDGNVENNWRLKDEGQQAQMAVLFPPF